MGLQSQLNDVSTDSIPLLLIATIAVIVSHFRSIFISFLHFLHFNRADTRSDYASLFLGSGFSNVVILADQLNMNRRFAYKFGDSDEDRIDSDCVVCLCGLEKGDEVRKLKCGHVFHKSCVDGWIDHLNFNCPLCRSPLV